MSSKKDRLANAIKADNFAPITPIKTVDITVPTQANNRTVTPTERVNDRTTERANARPPKTALPKRKDGIVNTVRYSFEITQDLKTELNRAIAQRQLDTGERVSASDVIRKALSKHLKSGKL